MNKLDNVLQPFRFTAFFVVSIGSRVWEWELGYDLTVCKDIPLDVKSLILDIKFLIEKKNFFLKRVFYLNPTHNCCSVSLHGSEVECWADYNKRIIPIIIGAAVVCLILISLMSFLVVRDRRRDGYERIWMAKSSLWNWTGGGGGGCYWLVHTLALSLVLFLNLHLACHILLLTAKTVCLVFTIWINKTFF